MALPARPAPRFSGHNRSYVYGGAGAHAFVPLSRTARFRTTRGSERRRAGLICARRAQGAPAPSRVARLEDGRRHGRWPGEGYASGLRGHGVRDGEPFLVRVAGDGGRPGFIGRRGQQAVRASRGRHGARDDDRLGFGAVRRDRVDALGGGGADRRGAGRPLRAARRRASQRFDPRRPVRRYGARLDGLPLSSGRPAVGERRELRAACAGVLERGPRRPAGMARQPLEPRLVSKALLRRLDAARGERRGGHR